MSEHIHKVDEANCSAVNVPVYRSTWSKLDRIVSDSRPILTEKVLLIAQTVKKRTHFCLISAQNRDFAASTASMRAKLHR